MSSATDLERLANREYQYGFVTDIESETIPPGLNEDIVRLISAKKERAGVAARVAAQGAARASSSCSSTRREPTWANVHVPDDRLPGHHLLLGAEAEEEAREPRRGRPGAARDLREARHPAARAEAARGRRRRRGLRQRLGRDDVQGQAREARHHLLLVLRGGAEAPRARARSTSARSCPTPTTSSRRSTRRSSATARSSTSRRACAARWSSRPTSASTRPSTGPVRAHADRRRRGRVRLLPRGLHGAACATRTSSTPRSSSSSRSTTPRSSTRPCRTGTRATRKARAASTTS